jgi:pimeloyl-ACP methyl ester carboxylesterase
MMARATTECRRTAHDVGLAAIPPRKVTIIVAPPQVIELGGYHRKELFRAFHVAKMLHGSKASTWSIEPAAKRSTYMKFLSSKRSLVGPRAGKQLSLIGDHPYAAGAAVGVAALAISALVNRKVAKTAERLNPPQGQFLQVDGVRLHYVERGKGEPLVLLHGNGSMIQDFESSGLLDKAAKKYRVIVFDRPGHGHSRRPRGTLWSPEAQADLIHEALVELDATPAIVLGHSWGASVAVALALKHKAGVKALVLASGYYYPTVRVGVVAASGPAIPILGDILRYTLAPILGRIIWPLLMRKMFGPAEVPQKFTDGFPVGLALRPSQIRASAAESALMIPDALKLSGKYGDLTMPVVIIAGKLDRLIDPDRQSAQLHSDIGHSTFHSVAGAGHMVHQTAMAKVMAAIDEAAGAAHGKPKPQVVAPAA